MIHYADNLKMNTKDKHKSQFIETTTKELFRHPVKYSPRTRRFEADKFSESVTQDTDPGFADLQPGCARSQLLKGRPK
jgi:hypothetical protein